MPPRACKPLFLEAYKGGALLLGDLDGVEDDLVSQENHIFTHKVSKYFKINLNY